LTENIRMILALQVWWEVAKNDCIKQIAELSVYFKGDRLLSRDARDDRLNVIFAFVMTGIKLNTNLRIQIWFSRVHTQDFAL
jgi:hypothetical protein